MAVDHALEELMGMLGKIIYSVTSSRSFMICSKCVKLNLIQKEQLANYTLALKKIKTIKKIGY